MHNSNLQNHVIQSIKIFFKSHKCQMNEAIKNLEASQQAHAVEMKRLQENNQLQSEMTVFFPKPHNNKNAK